MYELSANILCLIGTIYLLSRISLRSQKKYKRNKMINTELRLIEPVFGECFDPEEITAILSLSKDDIDERFPIQSVSTGIPFVFVPLKTLDAVRRAKVFKNKLFDWIKDKKAKVIFVFCPETYNRENDMNVRLFAEHTTRRAASLAILRLGTRILKRSAMIAITTSNSIKVKPLDALMNPHPHLT